MNLAIDIGNTVSKLAIFKGKELFSKMVVEGKPNEALYAELKNDNPGLHHVILSSVKNTDQQTIVFLKKSFHLLELSAQTLLPINNLYTAPETLGNDRIAGVVGATKYFPNNNILVIDAGTCITYDFINSDNEYLGGSISPGLEMRFQALHTFTARLPLIKPDENVDEVIGNSTEKSIVSGVQIGMVAEIEGIIKKYESHYRNLKILLTGGNSNFFVKKLKNPIFAAPDLVLEGLNEILDYNVQK